MSEHRSDEHVDIERLFETGNEAALNTYLHLLHPADVAKLFSIVDSSRWSKLTASMPGDKLAEVLVELDENQRETLAEILKPERLIEAVDELETDDAADVLAVLPHEQSAAILRKLEDKANIEVLLAFPEDTAGGIMQTEVCKVQEGSAVSDAIDAIREFREEVDEVYDVYVVDRQDHLGGTVALEDLVLSKPTTPLRDIRREVDVTVPVGMDQEEVAQLFKKYDMTAAPVVDPTGKLLGRITFDDVHDVLEEEATEDVMTMAGSSNEELVYGGQFFRIALFRLPWLLSSLLGSLVTTQLVPMFSDVPGDTLVLAAFVPVVMAMSGNVGSQSAMIITRGFAIGRVDFSSLGRTFTREIFVGYIMGMAAGAVVSVFAYLTRGDVTLGVALGLSMIGSMGMATAVGVAAPAVFKKLGIDPAIAAGPLVTTGCDVMGVSIYLLVAYLVLG